ncbi:NUDIX hydrolase [Streptomyces sp. NPDC059786]|uniref:NUDIX hydrolase n=1 Tax=Streptomyces sp. NPDC059786 TaxID=3346946 RepID=UPI0036507942
MTDQTRNAEELRPLAPLAALIAQIVRDTPIRMGPGGTDDLTAQLTVQTCVWVGKNVLPRTRGLAAFVADVDAERQRQLAKWGEQHHPDGTGQYPETIDADVARMACQNAAEGGYLDWLHILREEVAEALAESDPARLRTELVQVAAVCSAWIADLDARPASGVVR